MQYRRLGRSLVAAATAAVCIVALGGTAHAEVGKCKTAIIKATASFLQAKAKALQKCEDQVVKGKLSQSTVCSAEAKAAPAIAKASTKLTTAIDKACGGKIDKVCGGDTTEEDGGTALGFPATCPNFEGGTCNNTIGTTDCTGIAACLQCISGKAADQAISLSYQNLVTTNPKVKAEKPLNKCQAAIGKAAVTFLAAKSKALSACWGAVIKGKANVPCPVPGDGKAATKIVAAVTKLATNIRKACAGKDKLFGGIDANADFTPSQIGFPASCLELDPPGTEGPCGGAVNDLQGIITCLTCVNEFKVDCADRAGAATLAEYPSSECNAPPTPTPTATPIATPTAPPSCNNGALDAGEVCDPTSSTITCPNVNNALFPCKSNTCTCDCPSKVHFTGTATDPASILDTGWTGIAHRAPIISNGDVTVALSCATTGRPCGTCTVSGPVDNPAADAGQLNNHRCSNNSAIKCSTNAQCSGGGTCVYYFGSNLPLGAGGVTTCVVNKFVGSVSGTANVESGEAVNAAHLSSSVYLGLTVDNPCPRCTGDGAVNDGTAGGTCNGGTRNTLACDSNGSIPGRPDFGASSLDCPPDPGAFIVTLPIDLSNATDPVTKTLSTASPTCGGSSEPERCLCDTCNSLAAEPCDDNSDCSDPAGPIGPICGGKRCIGGPNNGSACNGNSQCVGGPNDFAGCTVASQCPSGTCTRFCNTAVTCVGGTNAGATCIANSQCPGGSCPTGFCNRTGEPSQPSACLDDTTTAGILDCADPDLDGEGECVPGPPTGACTVASGHAQRACTTEAECGGGAGSCVIDNRRCFLTGGLTGRTGTNTLIAQGMEDAPMNDISNPTLGAVFCIAPTGLSAIDSVAGLPGPGRVTIKGTAEGLP